MFLEKATSHCHKYYLSMMLTLLVCNLAFLLFSSPKVFAVNTSIAITGNAVINQATPSKDGTNYFRSLNVNVKTDSDAGYELYISGGTEDSALSSTDPLNNFKINSVSGYNNFIDDMKTNTATTPKIPITTIITTSQNSVLQLSLLPPKTLPMIISN